MSESGWMACSGLLELPDVCVGDMLECTQEVIGYGLCDAGGYTYAYPGDLALVVSAGPESCYGVPAKVNIMFLSGGSITIDTWTYKKHWRKLEDFPKTLKEIWNYQKGIFGMRRYKTKRKE